MELKIDDEVVKVKVIETRVFEGEGEGEGGATITLGAGKHAGLIIKCLGDTFLEVLTLQPPTKKPMAAKSFVNGLRGKAILRS